MGNLRGCCRIRVDFFELGQFFFVSIFTNHCARVMAVRSELAAETISRPAIKQITVASVFFFINGNVAVTEGAAKTETLFAGIESQAGLVQESSAQSPGILGTDDRVLADFTQFETGAASGATDAGLVEQRALLAVVTDAIQRIGRVEASGLRGFDGNGRPTECVRRSSHNSAAAETTQEENKAGDRLHFDIIHSAEKPIAH